MKTRRGEEGLGGIEGLSFGVLIFVFGVLLVVNAWAVIDAKLATSNAAREAVRAYVEGNDQTSATTNALKTQRAHKAPIAIAFVNEGYGRCAPVVASATVKVDRVSLPMIGGAGGTYTVTSSHSEIIDPYKSGLSGTANC